MKGRSDVLHQENSIFLRERPRLPLEDENCLRLNSNCRGLINPQWPLTKHESSARFNHSLNMSREPRGTHFFCSQYLHTFSLGGDRVLVPSKYPRATSGRNRRVWSTTPREQEFDFVSLWFQTTELFSEETWSPAACPGLDFLDNRRLLRRRLLKEN